MTSLCILLPVESMFQVLHVGNTALHSDEDLKHNCSIPSSNFSAFNPMVRANPEHEPMLVPQTTSKSSMRGRPQRDSIAWSITTRFAPLAPPPSRQRIRRGRTCLCAGVPHRFDGPM